MTRQLAVPIADLFKAYLSIKSISQKRQPLDLDLPERKIYLSDEGDVLSVAYKERLEAHKLVEEFMVMANVCAAETLEVKNSECLYRVHDEPSLEKLDALRSVANAAALPLVKAQRLKTSHLNRLLRSAKGSNDAEVINMTVLRTMQQAYYSPVNLGHYGLDIRQYTHFTSPIRRYADLVVHRALIGAHGWGDDGLCITDKDRLKEIGEWISKTERRSLLAERDTTDRYLAAYLSERQGDIFEGHVAGIAKFALFVKLLETGGDGIIPLGRLDREYWIYDDRSNTLTGKESGRLIAIGMPCKVTVVEANRTTGGLTLDMIELDGKPLLKAAIGKKTTRNKRRSIVKRKK